MSAISATKHVLKAPASCTCSIECPYIRGRMGLTKKVVTASRNLTVGDAHARVPKPGDGDIVIDADNWGRASEDYRDQCRAWLRANGIDPDITAVDDVEVHLVDAPAIATTQFVLDRDGRKQIDRTRGEPVTRRVHTLMRVPLPDHLREPW